MGKFSGPPFLLVEHLGKSPGKISTGLGEFPIDVLRVILGHGLVGFVHQG